VPARQTGFGINQGDIVVHHAQIYVEPAGKQTAGKVRQQPLGGSWPRGSGAQRI